ncbi:hypothetical protein [Bradyrhizobium guangzhouense]|uniref:hypothetical protein n=1 Tax=Bradyrhizobium guangzhouense TaxID=1325095 RepID=UPI0019D6B553|nr:hypothetical protein [Bradyrhizobium guangzhouense]
MKKLSKRPSKIVTRGPNKPKPITDERKIVSRKEAARILGRHIDTLKKLEDHRGGPLKVIRLNGPASNVHYRVCDVNALAGIEPATP